MGALKDAAIHGLKVADCKSHGVVGRRPIAGSGYGNADDKLTGCRDVETRSNIS